MQNGRRIASPVFVRRMLQWRRLASKKALLFRLPLGLLFGGLFLRRLALDGLLRRLSLRALPLGRLLLGGLALRSGLPLRRLLLRGFLLRRLLLRRFLLRRLFLGGLLRSGLTFR